MLCFTVNQNGRPVSAIDLSGAHIVGSDGVPLRAEIEYRDARLMCAKRADGPASLALLWPVAECGTILLETSRLMERDKPYNLPLEMARGRLMRMNAKREEWGLYDYDGVEPVTDQIHAARDVFIEAVKADEPGEQSSLAEQALRLALAAGERLSQFHAELLLARRKATHAFARRTLGVGVDVDNPADAYRLRLREGFEYAHLGIPWRMVEPEPGGYDWAAIDAWVEWLVKNQVPIKAGPLVSLAPGHIPEWLRRDLGDYEALRNQLFEYIRRVVERYGRAVHHWDVVSGLHAETAVPFTFEQVMELTRVAVTLVKQLAPQATACVDVVQPWGEYYARNQKTIPPMLYADMLVQSGVAFDAFGIQLLFGAPVEGLFVRDMFQISEKLDRLGSLGKPVHVTAVQVPSASPAVKGSNGGGCWHEPWSEALQARWLREFYAIALSKPFIESITWRDLADRPGAEPLPSGGLLRADLTPKPAYQALRELRAQITGATRRPPAAKSV